MGEPDDEGESRNEQNPAPNSEHPREDAGGEAENERVEDGHPMNNLTATATRTRLRSSVRTRVGTRCCAHVPRSTPSTAGKPTSAASDQLTSPSAPYAAMPKRAVKPIAASDVPVAQRVE